MIKREISKAIVTGPTGVVGVALCSTLLRHGCIVYAICRPESCRNMCLPTHEKLKMIECDMNEFDLLPDLISEGADAFFHLAWAAGERRSDIKSQISSIYASVEAIRIAKRMGCIVFVGGGSQAEYGRIDGKLAPDTQTSPETAYGISKLCAGQMCRLEAKALGIDCIWSRILSVYGPFERDNTMVSYTIRELLAGKQPDLTFGDQIWDFIYATDAGEALYRLAISGRSDAVYPIGSGTACPLRDYAKEIRDQIDPTLSLGFGNKPYSDKEVMFLQADISSLTRDTGFTPKVSFREGIAKTIAWIKTMYFNNMRAPVRRM